jgi:hypothetical protein
MRLHATDPLFAWARLEDHPQLSTLRHLLELALDSERPPTEEGPETDEQTGPTEQPRSEPSDTS